jgi:hypothetical protein
MAGDPDAAELVVSFCELGEDLMHTLCRRLVAALWAVPVLGAQIAAAAEPMAQPYWAAPAGFSFMDDLLRPMILAIVFTVVGVALFILSIWLVVRLCPFSVRKEIEEDQNMALGVIMGSIILGIAVVLAAAMIG